MEKRFNVFMDEELHKKIKIEATLKGMSMNEFILKAIADKLNLTVKK